MQLHKRGVVDAATAILDNYGIADLTMRRLGRELNVSPGTLYWHFANKQQLLGAVADRILKAPALAKDAPGGWHDRLSGICTRLRDALLSHTDGAELVSASFAAGQSEAMAHILARFGRGRHRCRSRTGARRVGRTNGRLLRARIHGRRAVPAAVGRRRRRTAGRAVRARRRCEQTVRFRARTARRRLERAGSVHRGATGIIRLKAPIVLDVVHPLRTARVH